jgi:GNAT superfamily N-acetyltransferase
VVSFTSCPMASLPEVLRFFRTVYSPNYILATSEALFRWQFGGAGTFVNGNLALKLAIVDGEIAGCVGYIPVTIQLSGEHFRGAWAANWAVDQQYRRLGLGPLLIRELAAQFDVALAIGGNHDAHSLLPRMGWTDFGFLPRFVCVVDDNAIAPMTESASFEWPSALRSMAIGEAPDDEIVLLEKFSSDAGELWDRVCAGVAGTRRTTAFLNWRYVAHPLFHYRLFAAEDGGRLRAIGVYRVEQVRDFPTRIGRIVELFGDESYRVPLLRALIRDGVDRGVSAFDFFCSDPRIESAMRETGFLLSSEAPASAVPALFQPVDRTRSGMLFMARLPKTSAARALADWYVTSADGDQDRPA